MKKTIVALFAVVSYILFSAVSCQEKEPFVNIKTIESQIYNEIKSLRESNGLSGAFVQNYPMSQEAQLYSAQRKFATGELDSMDLAEHWDVIHDKFGGWNDITLIQETTATTAEEIVSAWSADSTTNALLLYEDITQCGVGVEYNDENLAYVTVFMMYAESY